MTPEEFAEKAFRIWGRTYQAEASRYWGVSDRTVRYWVAGKRGIPENVATELNELYAELPAGGFVDPRTLYRQAIDAAVAGGWTRGQAAAAFLALAINDVRREIGEDGLRDLLPPHDR